MAVTAGDGNPLFLLGGQSEEVPHLFQKCRLHIVGDAVADGEKKPHLPARRVDDSCLLQSGSGRVVGTGGERREIHGDDVHMPDPTVGASGHRDGNGDATATTATVAGTNAARRTVVVNDPVASAISENA